MKYKEIEKYLDDNHLSLRKFAKLCDMPSSTMSYMLSGKIDAKKRNIDKILEVTGMEYEKCFREGEIVHEDKFEADKKEYTEDYYAGKHYCHCYCPCCNKKASVVEHFPDAMKMME